MKREWLRRFWMGLPHATEAVQWRTILYSRSVAKCSPLRPWSRVGFGFLFKCSSEDFAELTERKGVVPAPYLARASWVALADADALTMSKLEMYLRRAYQIIRAKLPRKISSNLV